MPPILDQHALIDDIGAGTHRAERPRRLTFPVAFAGRRLDLDDAAPGITETLQPRRLVLDALGGQELRVRVACLRAGVAGVTREIELDQMRALEKVIQIAW